MANEKRLIDANALKQALCTKEGAEALCHSTVKLARVSAIVDAQLTVDAVEVVHARWRWGYNSMNQYGAWCAECECGWEDKGTNDDFIRVQGLVIAHKYCPNCGAKMDGGNEDA